MSTQWVEVNIEELEVCFEGVSFLTDARIDLECKVYPTEKGDRINPPIPAEVEFRNFVVWEIGELQDKYGNTMSINKSSLTLRNAIEVWLETMTMEQREYLENQAIELDKSD